MKANIFPALKTKRTSSRRPLTLASSSLARLLSGLACLITGAIGANSAPAGEVAYEFEAQSKGARDWLANEGFEFKLDADNPSLARFALGDRGLTIETLGPAEPLLARPNLNVAQPAHLTVTWGINRYPVGADWDAGANNEAVMVIVFFGAEKLSGGFFCRRAHISSAFFFAKRDGAARR